MGLVLVGCGSAEDLRDEIVLEIFLPGGVGSLGQDEHQGEEVGQPEIVGCDGRVLLG